MPILGPTPSTSGYELVSDTCSPFWLRVAGVWQEVNGIDIDLQVDTSRPASEFRSLGGHRYTQRAPEKRRAWKVSLSRATPAGIAVLAAASDLEDVMLATEPVLLSNMLPARGCFGTSDAVDCGGVTLPSFVGGEVITAYVRGGVPTTLSCWSTVSSPADVTYPGGSTSIPVLPDGRQSVTFTPAEDGEATITITNWGISGLMLTEGDPPVNWAPGERMPCKVVVDDPGDVLLGFRDGAYRHNFDLTIREVD